MFNENKPQAQLTLADLGGCVLEKVGSKYMGLYFVPMGLFVLRNLVVPRNKHVGEAVFVVKAPKYNMTLHTLLLLFGYGRILI